MRVRPVRVLRQPRGRAWSLAAAIVEPALPATTRPRWTGGERIPETGGSVLALDHGRPPCYPAESGLLRGVRMIVGDPVPLSDLRVQPHTPAAVAAATDRIMDAISALVALVAQIRGQRPPAGRRHIDARRPGEPQEEHP